MAISVAGTKIKLARVVNTASKLIGNEQKQLSCIYHAALKTKASQIVYDPAHPLNEDFQKLPPGNVYRATLARN